MDTTGRVNVTYTIYADGENGIRFDVRVDNSLVFVKYFVDSAAMNKWASPIWNLDHPDH